VSTTLVDKDSLQRMHFDTFDTTRLIVVHNKSLGKMQLLKSDHKLTCFAATFVVLATERPCISFHSFINSFNWNLGFTDKLTSILYIQLYSICHSKNVH